MNSIWSSLPNFYSLQIRVQGDSQRIKRGKRGPCWDQQGFDLTLDQWQILPQNSDLLIHHIKSFTKLKLDQFSSHLDEVWHNVSGERQKTKTPTHFFTISRWKNQYLFTRWHASWWLYYQTSQIARDISNLYVSKYEDTWKQHSGSKVCTFLYHACLSKTKNNDPPSIFHNLIIKKSISLYTLACILVLDYHASRIERDMSNHKDAWKQFL